MKVSERQRRTALGLCRQAGEAAALACLMTVGTTDFRGDLSKVLIPALVIHGDRDATVPFGSARRTHEILEDSRLHVIDGGPHGINVSHADEFNRTLLAILR